MEVAVTTAQIAEAASKPGRKIPPGLPMPTDLQMVFDPSRRPRAARETRGRFPFPIPNGWFIVAASADIGPGDVTPLHYFDRDLVLFRGEDGAPYLVDAYCPHLGAHLGVGGRVEEGCIRCPVHGWRVCGGGR